MNLMNASSSVIYIGLQMREIWFANIHSPYPERPGSSGRGDGALAPQKVAGAAGAVAVVAAAAAAAAAFAGAWPPVHSRSRSVRRAC